MFLNVSRVELKVEAVGFYLAAGIEGGLALAGIWSGGEKKKERQLAGLRLKCGVISWYDLELKTSERRKNSDLSWDCELQTRTLPHLALWVEL